MRATIGTCGWQYEHWKQEFYRDAPQHKWLAKYAERYPTVEIDSAFYRLPTRRTFQNWAEQTPEDFVFAVKMSRYLTHVKRLHDAEEPVLRFLDRAEGMGHKLGPVLLQLPPTLQSDSELLASALAQFPRNVRVAMEFRHASWFSSETRDLLEKFGVALAVVDGAVPAPKWRTAEWGYVRFHGGRAKPEGCYGDEALLNAAEEIRNLYQRGDDVFVYFNNDGHGCALDNADTLIDLLDS